MVAGSGDQPWPMQQLVQHLTEQTGMPAGHTTIHVQLGSLLCAA